MPNTTEAPRAQIKSPVLPWRSTGGGTGAVHRESLLELVSEIAPPAAAASALETIEAMESRGGSFVRALGAAAAVADPDNLAKIRAAWPEIWSRYEEMAAQAAAMKGGSL